MSSKLDRLKGDRDALLLSRSQDRLNCQLHCSSSIHWVVGKACTQGFRRHEQTVILELLLVWVRVSCLFRDDLRQERVDSTQHLPYWLQEKTLFPGLNLGQCRSLDAVYRRCALESRSSLTPTGLTVEDRFEPVGGRGII